LGKKIIINARCHFEMQVPSSPQVIPRTDAGSQKALTSNPAATFDQGLLPDKMLYRPSKVTTLSFTVISNRERNLLPGGQPTGLFHLTAGFEV
jgi:hypothetical protein